MLEVRGWMGVERRDEAEARNVSAKKWQVPSFGDDWSECPQSTPLLLMTASLDVPHDVTPGPLPLLPLPQDMLEVVDVEGKREAGKSPELKVGVSGAV